MSHRLGRFIHIVLMVWLTWLFVFGWLPLLRSLMDGPSYEWGTTLFGYRFSGAGIGGDLWFVALKTAIGIALLWVGWRRPNGAFRWIPIAWLALMCADALFELLTAPGDQLFEGATLGISVSIALLAPVLHSIFLLLGLWWAIRAPKLASGRLNLGNYVLLVLALALLPIQYVLLRSGQGQEFNDVAGVLLTIGGWFLLSLSLAPWSARRSREPLLAA